ncbi:MAG: hypothetical protein HQ475_04015 [SAR202 cluster bacterium]|nr:hypothetical protein [SAR202 cluster bacterium]
MRRVIFLGLVLLALTALAACGGGEDAAPISGDSDTEVSLFEELLGTIPDTPDTRKYVMINDYAAIREIFQIPLPGPEAGQPALLEYLTGILGPGAHISQGPFITGLHRDAVSNPRGEYLAFDGRNVDQSVEAGIVPYILEIAWGRFDPAATAQALAACSECPPPENVTYNSVPFYSWGGDGQGDFQNRSGPPAFDELGRGGRIAVSSKFVYRTVETPGMKAIIDSSSGVGQSLADVEEFRLLGQAMSGLGAYAAFFSHETHKISTTPDETVTFGTLPGIQDKLIDEIGKSTLLLPYLAFSTGVGKDDIGPYMALALVHLDAESAEENERRLEKRVTERSDYPEVQEWLDVLEGITSQVDGRVLSAKIRGDSPASIWKSLSVAITPLIPHE